jgi:hypothetical protein
MATFVAAIVTTAIPAEAGCPITPRPECRVLEQSSFQIESQGQVRWRATRGPETSLEEFGDPGESSHYFFCAWDERGLLVAADIPPATECPDGECWCAVDAGFRYKDDTASNNGFQFLEMTASEGGKTKVRAETFVWGGINLPVTGDVLLQLSRPDSEICFESLITADEFAYNSSTSAAAKSIPDE